MRIYRTFTDVEESYFRDHPEEIDDYVSILFEEYAKDGDVKALLSSLRVIGRVKGLTKLADEAGMSRKGVQKALSEEGNPAFSSINAILHAMGYRLEAKRIDSCVGE